MTGGLAYSLAACGRHDDKSYPIYNWLPLYRLMSPPVVRHALAPEKKGR